MLTDVNQIFKVFVFLLEFETESFEFKSLEIK